MRQKWIKVLVVLLLVSSEKLCYTIGQVYSEDFNFGFADARDLINRLRINAVTGTQRSGYRNRLTNEQQTKRRLKSFVPPIITTDYGKIRGVKKEIRGSNLSPVVQYLGVPYAQPPIGDYRWEKPQLLQAWDGIKNATRKGPSCPQTIRGKMPDVLLPIWYQRSINYIEEVAQYMEEDCLYLNIYVPAKFYLREGKHPDFYREPLAVMVYIHGHTFSDGSGNFYDGSTLASYGDVIVVTVNYRLGVLGFLSTSDDNCPGNFGLWDQIEALQWVSKNIHVFGGDPTRVTLFGSGSGAASINLLMIAVQSDGKFARAILQSGTALAPWVIVKDPRRQAKEFARSPKIKCDDDSYSKIVQCLRKKTWKQLIDTNIQTDLYNLAFGPVVDGSRGILPATPADLMRRGEYLNYPILIGVSQGEGYGFVKKRISQALDFAASSKDKSSNFFEYTKENFQLDVANFIDSFYPNKARSKLIIERIVEFMYMDWMKGYDPDGLKRGLLNLYTDKQWVEPIVRTAALQANLGYQVHFYTLFHRPEDDAVPPWIDAGHGDELPYVFGAPLSDNDLLFPYNFTNMDKMISGGVMTFWTNFAKNGDPTDDKLQENGFNSIISNQLQELEWPKFEKDSQKHLEISVNPRISDHYRANLVAMWNKFLPSLLKEQQRALFVTSRALPIPSAPTSDLAPRIVPSSVKWTPKPGTLNQFDNVRQRSEVKSEGGISLQLSITLAIGFVLLFINIVAFAVVSYYKEKDKYKIEKLETELRTQRQSTSPTDVTNGNVKTASNGHDVVKKVVDSFAQPVTPNSVQEIKTLPRFSHPKSIPTRTLSANALPLVHTTLVRRDSLTSTPAGISDDGGSQNITNRSLKWKQLRKANEFTNTMYDLRNSDATGILNNKLNDGPSRMGIKENGRGSLPRNNSGQYLVKTVPSWEVDNNNRFKTMPLRKIPSVIKVIEPTDDESNRPSSLWTLTSSSAYDISDGRRLQSSVGSKEIPSAFDRNISPTFKSSNIPTFIPTTSIPYTESTCNSKLPLLISPINELSNINIDSSTSDSDHPIPMGKRDNVYAVADSGTKKRNVVTKL